MLLTSIKRKNNKTHVKMSKQKCRICGLVENCKQCACCFLKGCQKCIVLHKDSCSILKKDKIHLCSDHDDYVTGYCFTCCRLVCRNCSVDVEKHFNHNIFSIPEASHNIRIEIPTSIVDLEKREAQEESVTTQLSKKKNDYEKQLPAFLDAEENELHKVVKDTRDTLVNQIIDLNKKNLSDAKEVIPKLIAAKTNLKCVQGENFPIVFLSKWSNPRSVINTHDGILKSRESADDISMNNNADITRIFRSSLVS